MTTPQNGTDPPRPVPHLQRGPREYLIPNEVDRLIAAARQNRHGHRDAAMVVIVSRLCRETPRICSTDLTRGVTRARAVAKICRSSETFCDNFCDGGR